MKLGRALAQLAWEAPQSALGAALFLACVAARRVEEVELEGDRVVCRVDGLGVSLGHFVFHFAGAAPGFAPDPLMRRHELGHTHQSRALGPLYLPLVGVPSVSRVAYARLYLRLTGRRWTGYFDGWPERQADALGGVRRRERLAQQGR